MSVLPVGIDLFVFGGIYRQAKLTIVSDQVWKFDGTGWLNQIPLKRPVHNIRTIFIQNKILHFGGCHDVPCTQNTYK